MIAALMARVEMLASENSRLAARVAELEAKLGQPPKTPGNSSVPPDFADHPKVIDGCSKLMIDIFGQSGRHARSAIGVGSLPGNMTVEIEAIVLIAP